jgi:hypothetical protein
MKTSAPASARPSAAPGTRLRRLACVGLVAPVVALAACTGEAPVTADPTTPAGTTPVATSTTSEVPTTTPSTTSTPPKASTRIIKAVIKDPELGHTITALKVVRNLPFPKNQPVGAAAFEVVGVKVEFDAGSRYSAALEPSMLSLIAASPKQNVPITTEFGKAYKVDPLLTTKRDDRDRGWVFFKVDKGTTSYLRLAFNRPAYEVTTTDKSIKAKTFSVVLTK